MRIKICFRVIKRKWHSSKCQTYKWRNNNNNESFISDQAKGPDRDANAIQNKKKRK